MLRTEGEVEPVLSPGQLLVREATVEPHATGAEAFDRLSDEVWHPAIMPHPASSMPLSGSALARSIHYRLAMPDEPAMNQRVREGKALAETLIGLAADDASARVAEQGFHAEVVPPGWLVAADLDPARIVLVTDEAGRVTRAWGG